MFLLRRGFWANVVAAAAVFAVGGSALANSNSGSGLTSSAGTGAGVVSGYDITATSYTLNSANPQNTDAIVITYSGSPLPVSIRVSPDGVSGHYYYTEAANPSGNRCTANATTITCATTTTGGGHQGTVLELTNLTVVLAQ
jgi:hypothetical protein